VLKIKNAKNSSQIITLILINTSDYIYKIISMKIYNLKNILKNVKNLKYVNLIIIQIKRYLE
jgi:hypothetical protein